MQNTLGEMESPSCDSADGWQLHGLTATYLNVDLAQMGDSRLGFLFHKVNLFLLSKNDGHPVDAFSGAIRQFRNAQGVCGAYAHDSHKNGCAV